MSLVCLRLKKPCRAFLRFERFGFFRYPEEMSVIAIFSGENGRLRTLDTPARNCWVNAVAPSDDDISYLEQNLGVPRSFLTAALDTDERARTDKEDTSTLILLRVPYRQGEQADVPFTTLPVAVILADDRIVTVCSVDHPILRDFAEGQVAGFSPTKRNRFILQLLLRTAMHYLRYLREINREVDTLEDKLQRSMRNEELLGLLKYQKSLVYFTTSLRSNELMMERLRRSRLFETYPDDQDLLDDVLTENQQAIEMVGIANNILSQMMDAFASIISNNLNVVMKFLTSVTIVLTLPTLVASFYGMNVALPLQNSPHAFLLTLMFSLLLSFVVVLLFLKKHWF